MSASSHGAEHPVDQISCETGFGSTALAGAGRNDDWSTWGIGSRTQWDVTKTFYLGVEVLYEQMKSGTLNAAGTIPSGGPLALAGIAGQPAPGVNTSTQSNWMISVRAHRDFLP
jgi:hypothetical protein